MPSNATGDTSRELVAWDVNPDTLQAIKDGVIDATIAQKPFTMGYVGLKALDEIFHNPPAQLNKDYSVRCVLALPCICRYGYGAGGQEQRGRLPGCCAAHAQ